MRYFNDFIEKLTGFYPLDNKINVKLIYKYDSLYDSNTKKYTIRPHFVIIIVP